MINWTLFKNPANWIIVGTMWAFALIWLSLINRVSGEL